MIATVCSQCAAQVPSVLTTVQLSSSSRVSEAPRVNIGSTARANPLTNRGPRPGRPKLGTFGRMCMAEPIP